jgi:hypothetical protein
MVANVHEVDWKLESNGSADLGTSWIDSASLTTAFLDVPASNFAYDYINAIRDAGITTGCGGGNYCPGQIVTRDQMAAFIVRAKEGEPAASCASAPYSDVPVSNSFCKYIQRMAALNITTGCSNGNYCPSQNVTRDQMAAFIIRAVEGNPVAGYCGTTSSFGDVLTTNTFCGHIKRMLELNITTGCGNGNYCPTQTVTRDQMAAFLARAFLGMGTSPGRHYASMATADLGIGASLHGAIPFPANNAWNTDISGAAVDPNSAAIIASIGVNGSLFPDFGSGLYQGAKIGIPYVVVAGTQAKVAINYTAYGDESDPGPYPVPPAAPVEGTLADGSGGSDRHVLVIDRDNNRLYELGAAYKQANNSWNAACGATFHADSNIVRPGGQPGWTSADAAGLPIFPGLVRYDEASTGTIAHAFRFTVVQSRRAYVPPATHWASSNTSANLPPMGMRVRLKASYAIPSNFSTETKAILQALKTYGMMMADNGSNWFISGAPDERWNNDTLHSELGSVKGSDFEVVRMDGLVTP